VAVSAPPTDEFFLLNVQSSGQMLAQDVPAYRAGGVYLLEFEEFLAAVEFPITNVGDRWSGWYRSEDRDFDWQPRHGGTAVESGGPDDAVGWIEEPDGFYVPTQALEQWFDLDLAINERRQTLTIESAEPLPFQNRSERKDARARSRSREDPPPGLVIEDQYRWVTVPQLNVSGGVSTGRQSGRSVQTADSSITLGMDLLKHSVVYAGTMAMSRDKAGKRSNATHRLTLERAAPSANSTLPAGATHYMLGDIYQPAANLVLSGDSGRGLALIRAPDGQVGNASQVNVVGDAPPGWEVELYRNNALVDFGAVGSDGRYAFENQELMFGENRFLVRVFGPQGQVREEEQVFWGGGANLERHDYDYAISHVEFDRTLIDGMRDNADYLAASYTTDLRFSRAWTDNLQVGASYSRVGLGNERRDGSYADTDYLSVFGRMQAGPGILLVDASQQLDAGHAFKLEYLTGRRGHNIRLAHYTYADFESPTTLVGEDLDSLNEISLLGSLGGSERYWNYSLGLQHRQRPSGNSDIRVFHRLGTRFGRLSVSNEFEYVTRPYRDEMNGKLMLAGRHKRWNFRGEVDYRFNGAGGPIRQIMGTVNWNPSDRFSNNLFVAQTFAGDGSLQIGNQASWRIGNYNLSLRANSDLQGVWELGLGLNVSLGFDSARGQVVTDRRGLAHTGRAAMRLFLDEDNDGVRDPGERAVTAATYQDRQLDADGNGALSLNGLPRYQPVRIDTSKIKFDDPFLVPRAPAYEVYTHAGGDVSVDIPVVMTGDIEGYVYSDASKAPLRGATVRLVDSQGREVAAGRSEFDGYYGFIGIPSGDYQVRVSMGGPKAEERVEYVTLDGRVGFLVLDEIYLERDPEQDRNRVRAALR
jgi:hypothetical protein